MNAPKYSSADPPGTFVKMELDSRGWSQRDLAFILGQSEQQLNPLLSGKRAITADMARLLGDAFDVDAGFFANLQSQYDLRNAKEPDPAVRTRAELQSNFPVRDMLRRGWLREGDASLLELQVRRFFETDNDNHEPGTITFAAKRTQTEATPPTQLGWVHRVRQLARAIKVPAYSAEKLRDAVLKLRTLLIHPEAVAEVPAILADCGVRLVLVEVLPGAKIDGVCTWLDDQSPVIGLSTLHDRLDNFWFVLRHEIEHVLEAHGKDRIAIIDYLPGEGTSVMTGTEEQERIANDAAAEFCIPQSKMNSFYARKHPYFSEKDVLGFASVNGVHPALAIGQLQRRLGRYDYLRKYQVPVRKFLAPKALTDGWGNIVEAEL